MERYNDDRNHEVMVASAEVEYEGYCQLTRVEEIMTFARKIGARKIGIANCIGLINEARIFAQILRKNGFEPYAVICKVGGRRIRWWAFRLLARASGQPCVTPFCKPGC